jgi:hypothetical protein
MAFFSQSCYASFMQVVVEIRDEFAARVRLRGLTPEGYVQGLVDEAARTTFTALPPAKPRMEIESFLQAMAANSAKIPQLSDEAFMRESFYRDHD